jgi:hypothetical protein
LARGRTLIPAKKKIFGRDRKKDLKANKKKRSVFLRLYENRIKNKVKLKKKGKVRKKGG